MIFANITDIAIPEGNVIKIHETNSGRILWQKKQEEKVLSAHWEISPYEAVSNPAVATIGHWLDTGRELIITCNQYDENDPRNYYRYYNPIDNTFSPIHVMKIPTSPDYDENDDGFPYPIHADWAIDPLTKVWCSTTIGSKNFYYCSIFNDDTYRLLPTNVSRCCWSEALNRFCLTGLRKSYLMDTEGNIYEREDSSSPGQVLPYKTPSFVLCAGDGITKFIAYNHPASNTKSKSDSIVISPDGYDWTYIEKISDDLPDSSSNYDRGTGVTWVPPLNAYIAIVGNSSGYYTFKSTDGINWTKISEFKPTTTNASGTLSRTIDCAYSPELNIIAVFAGWNAYISNDGLNWIEVTAHGIFAGYSDWRKKFFIWSKTLNAFVYGTHAKEIRKLIIDC